LGVSFYPVHIVAQMTSHYKQECAKHGWEPTPDQLLYRAFIAVGEDDKEAAAFQAKFFVGDPTGDLFRGRGAAVPPPTQTQAGFGLGELRFCGGPNTVVRQISDFHAATGVGAIDVAFGGAGLTLQESMKSMRLFATEVLPRIRHIGVRSTHQQEPTMAAAD
jgi:alkanesulfonate monooxygenase SsuD/methylene tetrahydromethanopterin reductase-like flavin-dependent oxidoreductase (luciferase family)